MKTVENFYYLIPDSMKEEQTLIVEICSKLISQFNDRCKTIINEEKLIKQRLRESREWRYEIASLSAMGDFSPEVGEEWSVLLKTAINPIGENDDRQYSKPFKVINGVLLHSDGYLNKSWITANNRIPQGLISPEQLTTAAFGW